MKRFLCLFALPLVGCVSLDDYTQQKLQNTALINVGMGQDEVRRIMDAPAKVELSEDKVAWHYCRTGAPVDEFAVILFADNKVRQLKTYSLTLADTGGAMGDCTIFIRPFDFTAPDDVTELRVKTLSNH